MREGELVGDYRIVRPLGQGGMATVFVARDERHDREVVLKAMPPYLNSPEMEARFKREIHAIASLSHPNCVKVLDFSVTSTLAWYVMPFIPAVDLEKFWQSVRGESPVPPLLQFGPLRQILCDVTSALAHCHERGIYHRDIKPQNILVVTETKRGILSDFGLARAIDKTNITKSREMVGTLRYMSPEMITGEEVGASSDLYQIAMVAYEIFAGQLPLPAANPYDEVQRRLKEPIPSMRAFNPKISDEFSDLIVRTLSPDPAARPASADKLLEELKSVPVEARAGSKPPPSRTMALAVQRSQQISQEISVTALRRRRTGQAVAGGAAVAVALAIGAWALRADEPRGFAVRPRYQDAEVVSTSGPKFLVEVSGARMGGRVFESQAADGGWKATVSGLAPGQPYVARWVLEDGRRGPELPFTARELAVAQLRTVVEGPRLTVSFETSQAVIAKLVLAGDKTAELDREPGVTHRGTVELAQLGGPLMAVNLIDSEGQSVRLELGAVQLPEEPVAELIAACRALDLDKAFREISHPRSRSEDRHRYALRLQEGTFKRVVAALEAVRPFGRLYFANPQIAIGQRMALYDGVGKLMQTQQMFARESVPLDLKIDEVLGPTFAVGNKTHLEGSPAVAVELLKDQSLKANTVRDLEKVSKVVYDTLQAEKSDRTDVTVDHTIRGVGDLKRAELALTIKELHASCYFSVEINGRSRLLFFSPGFVKVKSSNKCVVHHAFDPALLVDGVNKFRVRIEVVAGWFLAKGSANVEVLELRAQ